MAEPSLLERTIDRAFSLQKRTLWLLSIILLGFILRLIAVRNISDSADSMHFVTEAIHFLSVGRLEVYDQSSGLWYALVSILYNLFGIIPLAARFPSLLFGTASILVMYLFAREFFDEKVSLLAAFLLALAPFHLMSSAAEMDVMAMFFSLASMALFVRALHLEKKRWYIAAGICLGLAIYTKVYPLLFVPSFILYTWYVEHKKGQKFISRQRMKHLLLFLVCAALFAIPTLTHNYLLYKDKGIMDFYFTRTLGLGQEKAEQYYGFDSGFHNTNDWHGFFFGNSKHGGENTAPLFIIVLTFILYPSPLIFILGILGLAFMLITKRHWNNYVVFFVLSVLFILPYLGSIILLAKHFLFLEMFLIPPAAFLLEYIIGRISTSLKRDSALLVLCTIFLLTLLWLTMPLPGTFAHFYGKNYVSQVIDFKNAYIPNNALIVADSRIYRGQIHWMFQGRHYLEAAEFMQIYTKQDMPGRDVAVDVFYVECVYDDCGWGTVSGQPEFNASMEAVTKAFQQSGTLLKTLNEPDKRHPYLPFITEKIPAIRIYQTRITMKDSVLTLADKPKNWFLYYVGYPEPSREFDAYTPHATIDSALDTFAHLLVRIALFLSLLAPLFFLWLVFAHKNNAQV